MDGSNPKRGKTFTAEQVRHYLGLDNDYDDDCSSSSSDNNSQEDSTLDSTSTSLSDINVSESDNETIIPPSPKRIKSYNSKRTSEKIVRSTCILAGLSSTCTKQEHGKPSCTVRRICRTPGTNPSPSPVTLHTTPHTAAETDTHLNRTGNHDKQKSVHVLAQEMQPRSDPTNTVSDTFIHSSSNGKEENHSTCTGTSTEQNNLTYSRNTSIELQPVPEHVFTIQLDIPPLNPESIVTDNTSPINLPEQVPSQSCQHQSTVNDNPPENETNLPPESPIQYQLANDNYLSDIEDQHEYYEVEIEPTPPDITDLYTPITNYSRDQVNEVDVANGWEKIEPDIIPDYGPFTGIQGINMDGHSREPEDFFNNLFEERMFTIMAEETNSYARRKIREIMAGRDHAQQMDHYSHRQHARLGHWKDLNPSDMKIFTAHLLIMSSVHKPALHNYWSTQTLSRTPFFGQYIGRNKFQEILWNLHVSDSKDNPPPGSPNHDPLAKVRPLLEMCQTNFKLRYTPGKHISLDESTMAFKGRVR